MIDASTHLDHVRRAGARIAEVADGRLKDDVPSMPGNDLGSLLLHTGGFCRFARCSTGSESLPELDFSDVGSDPLEWHLREHAALVAALEAADPEAPNWSWGTDQHARFWFRRAAQELSVHCWDAENAVGPAAPLDPALAVDGVDEFLDEFCGPPPVFLGREEGAAQMFGGDGETMHLHSTDAEGEWLVTCLPDRIDVRREHAKGDVAARGGASDLLLFLWGRVPPSALEVHGDAALLERWQDRVKI